MSSSAHLTDTIGSSTSCTEGSALRWLHGYLANGRPWLALLWLALGCGNASIALQQWNSGVDLTPQCAIVRGFRWRNVPWQVVQEVTGHTKSNGTSVVGLILDNGESVMLRASTSLWRKYDAQYERNFHRIDQYRLAHRGESWHRVPPRRPSHLFRSEERWFARSSTKGPPRLLGWSSLTRARTPVRASGLRK